MRDQKVMRAGMRNKEFILCGLMYKLDFVGLVNVLESEISPPIFRLMTLILANFS